MRAWKSIDELISVHIQIQVTHIIIVVGFIQKFLQK